MLNRFAPLAACLLLATGAAPLAAAEPDAAAPDVAIPDGAVASADPGILVTPDGYTLTVFAKDETQTIVAPLTTALSTREYLASGTFIGSVKGAGSTKLAGGTLEVGYQIGCGIGLQLVGIIPSIGFNPAFTNAGALSPNFSIPISQRIEVDLTAGKVVTIPVDKKKFKGTDPRVNLTDLHINIDGCVGQSYLRSYAILTSSTDNTDDVVTYLGVTKAV